MADARAIAAVELARDARDRFTIPKRLDGRQLAVKILLDTFDRVAAGEVNWHW